MIALEPSNPRAMPAAWAATKGSTDSGEIPAKVSLKTRPIVTAGLANEVDEVKKYAEPIQAATEIAMMFS